MNYANIKGDTFTKHPTLYLLPHFVTKQKDCDFLRDMLRCSEDIELRRPLRYGRLIPGDEDLCHKFYAYKLDKVGFGIMQQDIDFGELYYYRSKIINLKTRDKSISFACPIGAYLVHCKDKYLGDHRIVGVFPRERLSKYFRRRPGRRPRRKKALDGLKIVEG